MPKENSGRKSDQKMKPYLVYQYLLRNTDENHVVSAEQIVGFLQETCGIEAERRSIYKDIDAINRAVWVIENDEPIDAIDDEYFEDEKAIVYDKHFKGFYVRQRHFEASDIRLISECIYSSKYISQDEAERLVDIMREFVSEYQAEDIHADALVTNRVRTLNKSTLGNINVIYDAMSKEIDGEKHIPEKISFQYLKYSISDLDHQIERRKGVRYTVSPYKLIINDGNYYLLAFDDYSKEIRTYRVDRMKALKRIGLPREGKKEFSEIDLKTYTQRTFSMFSGEKEHVLIKFRMSLLDAAIERFGRANVSYIKNDEHHFTLSTDIEISDQFFGWLCGFGVGAQIVAPDHVKSKFEAFLDGIRKMY